MISNFSLDFRLDPGSFALKVIRSPLNIDALGTTSILFALFIRLIDA